MKARHNNVSTEYQINGEWYSYEEIAEAVPKGMALEFKRKMSSMTDEERQKFYDDLFENREEGSVVNGPKAADILSIWYKQTIQENARLRADKQNLQDEYDAMNEVISELQNERNQLSAEVERLESDVERYRKDSQELRREAAKRCRE